MVPLVAARAELAVTYGALREWLPRADPSVVRASLTAAATHRRRRWTVWFRRSDRRP